jgi:hypothetical protein
LEKYFIDHNFLLLFLKISFWKINFIGMGNDVLLYIVSPHDLKRHLMNLIKPAPAGISTFPPERFSAIDSNV